ncbi:MAG: hypothetical protein J6Z03_00645, partial [Erysipelotrichaceae bacterium]|nr:hypothetical protein [Erysipelotrichaceae bacterium]
MKLDIKKAIIDLYNYSDDKQQYLNNFSVVDALFRKSNELLIVKAENDEVLPYSIYADILDYFSSLELKNVKLYIKARNQDLPIREINLYLEEYRKNNDGFKACVPMIDNDGFTLSYTEESEYEKDSDNIEELILFFYDLGYRKTISMKINKPEVNKAVEVEALPQPVKKPEPVNNKPAGEKT